MVNVFVSYDRAHQDIVRKLVQDLKDDEHETWFDQSWKAANNGGRPSYPRSEKPSYL